MVNLDSSQLQSRQHAMGECMLRCSWLGIVPCLQLKFHFISHHNRRDDKLSLEVGVGEGRGEVADVKRDCGARRWGYWCETELRSTLVGLLMRSGTTKCGGRASKGGGNDCTDQALFVSKLTKVHYSSLRWVPLVAQLVDPYFLLELDWIWCSP